MLSTDLCVCIPPSASAGGGGANTKVPDMYGVGGCFRDPKHKSNMYTFCLEKVLSEMRLLTS